MRTVIRDSNTVHLFGTHHLLSHETLQDLRENPPSYLTEALQESEAAFFEYVELPEDFWDTHLALHRYGTPDHPSLQSVIGQWDATRQEAFLSSLSAFPGMDHVSRRASVLDMQPWAASWYIDTFHIPSTLGGDSTSRVAVDDWIKEEALQRQMTRIGLEDSDPHAAGRTFANMDPEAELLALEALLHARPDRETLVDAWRSRYRRSSDRYIEGRPSDWREVFDREYLRAVGVPEDRIAAVDDALENRRADWSRERDSLWASVLEDALDDEDDTVFVAVGYSHLTEQPGVLLSILLERGFEIDTVYPESAAAALSATE